MQLYGYPMLWCSVFVAAIGIPFPISLILLAAGAFASLGDFNIVLLALLTVSASTGGDTIGYFIGRKLGSRLLDWLGRKQKFRIISPKTIIQAQDYFKRRGVWAIFLSRFLFTGLGSIVNLIAGAEVYPYKRFLLFDFLGEFVGALIPLTLGFVFEESWEAVGAVLGAFSLLMLTLLITAILIVVLLRIVRSTARVGGTHILLVPPSLQATREPTGKTPDSLPL